MIVDILTSHFFARAFATVGRSLNFFFLSGEKIARASASLGEFHFFLFIEPTLPGPKLVLLTPSEMLLSLLFFFETPPDTCSCLVRQKNRQGSRQFGEVSNFFLHRTTSSGPKLVVKTPSDMLLSTPVSFL